MKKYLLALTLLSSCFEPSFSEGGVQCADQIDNDGDDLIDCQEVECAAAANCVALCGNAIAEGEEECDNGSANSDTIPGACRLDCTRARCGDSVIDPNELCDGEPQETCQDLGFDGGVLLCDGECQLDESGCTSVEICDDGEDNDDDGLTDCSDCGDCDGDPICDKSLTCLNFEICGDGIDNNDNTLVDCEDPDCAKATECQAGNCGNNIQELGEQCDGDDTGGLNCSDIGAGQGPLLCDPSCTFNTSLCVFTPEDCANGADDDGDGLIDCEDINCDAAPNCNPFCGNTLVEFPEQCDGDNLNGNDCTSFGTTFTGGVLSCNANCSFNTSNCVVPFCGDGIPDPNLGEQCDDGNQVTGDGCSAFCATEFCGDFITSPALGEQCDEGPVNNFACDTDCTFTICGDGTRNVNVEQCDDGNLLNGDGCRDICTLELCGDNLLDPQEQCDDGNTANGDGCNAVCQIELPVCGDGNRAATEQCDDGNNVSNDGCSSTCQLEGVIQEAESNNTFQTANLLEDPDVVAAGAVVGSDTDFFSVFLLAGTTIRFETAGVGGLGTCDGDTIMRLIEPDGTGVLGFDDDGGVSPCSRLEVFIPVSGAYALQLNAFNQGNVPTYLLFVTDITPVPFCGNGIAEVGEECDGGDFNGATCSSETGGLLPEGNLSCGGCVIDSSSCFCTICP